MRKIFENKSRQGLPEVGFLIPETEMTSDRVLNILLREISQFQIQPVFYFVDQPADPRYDLHPDLKTLGFMEKKLMAEVVNPFIRESVANGKQPEGTYLPLDILAERHGARVVHVKNMNDPDFVEKEVSSKKMEQILFMVRQRTIAKLLVDACEKKKTSKLMNIHPARLPGIRGLMGPFWSRIHAVMHELSKSTITLHDVTSHEIDTGAIRTWTSIAISHENSIGLETINGAPKIAEMLYEEIDLRVKRSGARMTIIPEPANSTYKTVPTPEEVEGAKQKHDIHLVNTEEMLDYILKHYSSEDHPEHRQELEHRCKAAINAHKAIVNAKFDLNDDDDAFQAPGM